MIQQLLKAEITEPIGAASYECGVTRTGHHNSGSLVNYLEDGASVATLHVDASPIAGSSYPSDWLRSCGPPGAGTLAESNDAFSQSI